MTAAFWPGWSDATVTVKWAALSLAPLLLMWTGPLRCSLIHILAGCLVAWMACSLAWAPHVDASLWGVVIGCVLFCVGYELERLEPLYAGLAIGLAPSSLISLWQALHGEVPSGLFGGSSPMGEVAALAVLGLIAHRMWAWLPLALPALVLAQSRASFLALTMALICFRGRAAGLLLAIAVVSIGLLPAQLRPVITATSSFQERVSVWSASLPAISAFGRGLGSYPDVMAQENLLRDRVITHAHNEILEAAIELGYVATLGALVLFVLVCARARPADNAILLGLFVLSLLGYPLAMPATVLVGALVAGHAARGWRGLCPCELVGRVVLRVEPERGIVRAQGGGDRMRAAVLPV